MDCPCHSGKAYGECCAPFHQGEALPSALELMRSRYAAYALGLADYIIATTHPNNSQYLKDQEEWKRAIDDFSKNCTFENLEILQNDEKGNKATVTFKATLLQNGRDCSFTEKSLFEKSAGRWLYLQGVVFR